MTKETQYKKALANVLYYQALAMNKAELQPVLFFDEDTTDRTIEAGATLESDFVCNLATVHSILIKSSMGQANVLSTRAGNSTTLQKISVDVNSNRIIYMNQQDYRQVSISQSNVIDEIRFEITDQNNNLLQLNNVNYEFSIIFEIYPKYIRQNLNENNRRRGLTDNGIRPIQSTNQNQLNNVSTQNKIINRPIEVIDDDELLINSSHPIENKSQIKHKTDRIILDQLIDQIS